MDEPPTSNLPPSGEPAGREIPPHFLPRLRWPIQKLLPRRIALLFASSLAAFSLTAWFLARVNNAADIPQDPGSAESVIREQLDALSQGETRVAYGFCSPRYRSEAPFERFDALVREHAAMFRTTSIRKESEIVTVARSEITMRLETASGEHIAARYTLVVIEGRWWIDEMRWHADGPPASRIVAREIVSAGARANARG